MDADRARELLSRERERIEHAIGELERDPNESEELSHTDQHPGDTASELFQREHEAGLAVHLRADLEAIERAEARLAGDSYGRSIESGEPIPDARLEAMPWAERTVEEQARYDRA